MHIEDLSYSYDKERVLDGITFDIEDGEILGILGLNGCGKTTLLKNLNRNLSPESGCVLIDGKDVANMEKRDIAEHIGSVPQTNEIRFSFTVRDIVSMGRMPYLKRFAGESSKDLRIVDDALERTGLTDMADRYINTMSGGQRQRVIIARALAQTPKVILLDEPTLHLDICTQFDTLDLMRKLSREDGMTVVIVSHDLPMVARYCDRILLISDHRIHSMGTPEEVLTPENMREVFRIEAILEKDEITGHNTVRLFGSTKE